MINSSQNHLNVDKASHPQIVNIIIIIIIMHRLLSLFTTGQPGDRAVTQSCVLRVSQSDL